MRKDLYIITCAARTGSSLLETSLLSHPEVLSHGEVYHPSKIGALRGKYTSLVGNETSNKTMTEFRERNQVAFLYKYVFDAQGHSSVGCKFKHEELLLPCFAETREAIRRDKDIKIIHLRRENLFERFVSWWIANKVTGITEIHSEDQRPEIKPFEIPFSACKENFDEVTARYNFVRNMLREHPSHEVSYEELTGENSNDEFSLLLDFLGVSRRPLQSRLKKVVSMEMRQIVSNYAELKIAFQNSNYASFFGD